MVMSNNINKYCYDTPKKPMLANIWIIALLIASISGGIAIGYYALEPRVIIETETETETETVFVGNNMENITINTIVSDVETRLYDYQYINDTVLDNDDISDVLYTLQDNTMYCQSFMILSDEEIVYVDAFNIDGQESLSSTEFNITIWDTYVEGSVSSIPVNIVYTEIRNGIGITEPVALNLSRTTANTFFYSFNTTATGLELYVSDDDDTGYALTPSIYSPDSGETYIVLDNEGVVNYDFVMNYTYHETETYEMIGTDSGVIVFYRFGFEYNAIGNTTYTSFLNIMNDEILEWDEEGMPPLVNSNSTYTIFTNNSIESFTSMEVVCASELFAYSDLGEMILQATNNNTRSIMGILLGSITNSSFTFEPGEEYTIELTTISLYQILDSDTNGYFYPVVISVSINDVNYDFMVSLYGLEFD